MQCGISNQIAVFQHYHGHAQMQKLHISVKHYESIQVLGKHVPRNINHNVMSHTTVNYCNPV